MAPTYLNYAESSAIQQLISQVDIEEVCLWDIDSHTYEGAYYYLSDLRGNPYSFKEMLEKLIIQKRLLRPNDSDNYALRGILYRYGIRYKK